MNIVFLDEYSLGGIDLSRIKQLGNYTGYEKTTPGEIAERCIDADIVITNKVPLRAEAIKVLPQLKLICIAATGMNNVDLEAAAERGIEVRNAVGYSTHAVTETTIGAAIALLRQSIYYDRYVKSGEYAASDAPFHSDGRSTSSTANAGVSSAWEPSGTRSPKSPQPSAARSPILRLRVSNGRNPTPPCRSTNCSAGRTSCRSTLP